MILIDSSIWIDYFKGGLQSQNLSILLEKDLVLTNDIILSELIPVLKHKGEFEAANYLLKLRNQKLDIFWEGLRKLQELNLKKGINRVGLPDLIISQQCINDSIELWSLDKHFQLMSAHVELKLFDFLS